MIQLDVAKAGAQLFNLNNVFNARVHDGFTPVKVQWINSTDGNKPLDVKGMKAFLKGRIGQGTITDDHVELEPKSDLASWADDGSGSQPNGVTLIKLPPQVFTRDGIFYGYIGLADANGTVITSINIWFNVDQNIMTAGANVPYYLDEIQAALSAVQESTDTLQRAKQEIDSQIYLSRLTFEPEVFENLAALQAKYPNGAPGMMVTADNEHKYVYLNNQWEDKGQFVFNDLNPQDKKMLYARSSDNILTNPDLKDNAAGWQVAGNWDMDPAHAIGNSMAYGVKLATDTTSSFVQENIPVPKGDSISAGIKVITVGVTGTNFQLLFKDDSNNIINDAVYNVAVPSDTNNVFKLVKIEEVVVPQNAVTAAVTIAGKGQGLLIICRPQLNLNRMIVPYSLQELKHETNDVNNLLTNPDLQYDADGWQKVGPWQEDPAHAIGNSMAYRCYLTEKPDKPAQIYQEKINIEKRSLASIGIQVLTNNATSANMQLFFKDVNNKIIENAVQAISLPLNTLDGFETVKIENTVVPDNAVTATATLTMEDKGLVVICRPQLNAERQLIPYSTRELAKTANQDHDNVLINPDLKNEANGWTYFGRWEVDKTNSINGSVAYGCYQTEKPASPSIFYQEDVSVDKKKVLSAGVEAITSSAVNVVFQVLFRDKNHNIIVGTDRSIKLPSDTKSVYHLFKLEGLPIPENAATAAVTVANADKGLVVFCRPRLYFDKKLIPYSLSELVLDSTNSLNHELPFFKFDINRDGVANDWVKTSFSYIENDREIDGYAQIAIQGDSSRTYPKKNYKIKLFSDSDCKQSLKVRLKPSWPETNKFNLKANWIDATQSRNLASAKLVAAATAITPIADHTVESNLAKTSNFGQMEGFPIEVWFGETYNGLYTCNTKKDDKVFGLDANKPGNAAVSILDDVPAPDSQLLKVPTAKLDNVAYADELHDTPDPELVTNWSKWLEFLNNSTDDDFKANLASYIDVKSAINLYLFGVLSREYDYYSKSVLYLTWNNGKYFYLIPYDLDSNWGQAANGEIEGNPTEDGNWGFATETTTKQDGKSISNVGWNKLFERMYKLFMPEIKEQYTYLRSSVWRTDQLLDAYRDFMNGVPQEAYEKDQKLWPQIPSLSTNNYEQLHQVIVQRSNQMDRWIKSK